MSPLGSFLVACAVSVASVLTMAAVTMVTMPATVHAVVFPRSGDAALLAVAPYGRILDSWFDGAVIVASPEHDGFAAAIRSAGAWLVVPLPRSAGCAPANRLPGDKI